jgi:hypothetical protein
LRLVCCLSLCFFVESDYFLNFSSVLKGSYLKACKFVLNTSSSGSNAEDSVRVVRAAEKSDSDLQINKRALVDFGLIWFQKSDRQPSEEGASDSDDDDDYDEGNTLVQRDLLFDALDEHAAAIFGLFVQAAAAKKNLT